MPGAEAEPPNPAPASERAAFFRQSGWLMVASIVGGVFMWAVHFLGKSVGPKEYGAFIAYLSVAMCIPTMPLQMVLAHQTAKALATDRERELAGMIRVIWLVTLLLWLVSCVGVLLAQHTIDMVALLLKTGPDQSELAQQRGYSAARLELIHNDIIKNLSDPRLTIAAVAMRQGCHPKQVQRLFAGTGSTFTEFVLEQRLQKARRLLSSPIGGSKKISEIAYDVGFSDLAYFNRTFRSRFGMTPSDCRFDCTVS